MPSEYALLFTSTIIEVFVLLFVGYEVVAGEVRHRHSNQAVMGGSLNNAASRSRISMRLGMFIVLVSGAIWATVLIAYQQLSGTPTALSTRTVYYVGLGLFVLAIVVGAVLWKINRPHRLTVATSSLGLTLDGLYVGQIHASFDRFADDYCIELAIRGYNGSGETIAIGQLRGAIRYGEIVNSRTEEKEMLPPPALLADRTNIASIAHGTEIFLVLEQRVPRAVAARMAELFEAGHTVTFDLRSLEIPVSAVDRPGQSHTLPVYSLTFKKADGIVVRRITYASINATIGVTDALR